MTSKRVIIIGGGIIGLASAHYLKRAGCQVMVLDQDKIGGACSHGNCGLISPSHVLPLNMPGAVTKTLKAMTHPNSPFAIKPRFDLSLFSWLFKFMRRCNEKDMLASAEGRHALLQSSRKLYDDLTINEQLECELETEGCLFVYQTKEAMDAYDEVNKLVGKKFGVEAKRLNENELLDLEPSLKPGIAGGFLYEMDAHMRPDILITNWKTKLENEGVIFCENTEAQYFSRKHGKIVSVTTADGVLPADDFLFTAGAWSPFLNREVGCRIPIQPGKGYSLTMPRPRQCPKYPMLFQEHKVAVTPMLSGYRLGSTMEFAGYDTSINPKRLQLLKDAAELYLFEPHAKPIEEEWYGWRPMTYDGKPIIDRSPKFENVWIAAGHNMLGLSMGPGTGKLIAELMTGKDPHIDPSHFAATRF